MAGQAARLRRTPADPPSAAAGMYEAAVAAAQTPEEKRLVLAGLGAWRCLQALKLAEPYLDEAAVAGDAAETVARIAEGIARDHKDDAVAALKKASGKAADPRVQRYIRELLAKFAPPGK